MRLPSGRRPSFEKSQCFSTRREIERMLTHEALGELGVARLEADDLHVVLDRARRDRAARSSSGDRPHMDEEIVDRLAHQIRARQRMIAW
jgi:hypothetical protein